MASNSAGGVFLPNDPPPSTNQVLTTPSISSPTLTGTVTGTVTLGGTTTLTAPTITAPVISGAATMASGAVLTTPTVKVTTTGVTGTGATGSTAAVLPTVYPAFLTVTGASGSGVALLTGPAGSAFFINNVTTGALNVYCVGGTINGTTGTTAFPITATGNHSAWAYCTTATGAWFVAGNT